MEVVIGAIIVLMVILLITFFNRKKYHNEVDKLEEWKLELMNRPVSTELAKVKRLNMTGQTEEMFERWRATWDQILTEQIPEIDNHLFESEEWIDQFRFGKAKEVNHKIEVQLADAERKIDEILKELNELMGSEEKNREESEEVKEKQRQARKQLLAHRHTFGKAAPILEIQLDAISSQFEKFEELTREGNYLEARETVLAIQRDIDALLHKMERIPELLTESNSIIPSNLNELEEGYKEMEQQGYILDHLQIGKEIARLREQVEAYRDYLAQTEIEEVESGIQEAKDNIELLYDLLEKEVQAKHYIMQNSNSTKDTIEEIKYEVANLREETEFVQQSYHLAETEMGIPNKLSKEIIQLERRFEMLAHKIFSQQSAFSFLHDELKEIRNQLEEIKKEEYGFAEFLQTLRKEELEAKDKLSQLRKKINETTKTVQKSNVPGLPDYYQSLMEEAQDCIEQVIHSLKEKPLNIKAVQEHLAQAVDSVNHLNEKTDELIEQVRMAERIIQYGNRYRSSYPAVAEQLRQAEMAFRNYDYREAVEQAAAAIERVNPKALKQLEEMLNEHV